MIFKFEPFLSENFLSFVLFFNHMVFGNVLKWQYVAESHFQLRERPFDFYGVRGGGTRGGGGEKEIASTRLSKKK